MISGLLVAAGRAAIAWSDLDYLNGSPEQTRYRGVSFSS
jgi:hypothetical protein